MPPRLTTTARRLACLARLRVGHVALAFAVFGVCACGQPPSHDKSAAPASPGAAESGACPSRAPAPSPLPGVSPEERTLAYWLAHYSAAQLDAPILDAQQIATYNTVIGRRIGHEPYSQRDLGVPIDPLALANDVHDRLRSMAPLIDKHELVNAQGAPLTAAELAAFSATLPALTPSLRVVLADTPLRCGPYDGPLYKLPIEPTYDKNACGTLRAQDPIEVLAQGPGELTLVRSRYSLGYLGKSAKLSPPVPSKLSDAVLHGARLRSAQANNISLSGGGNLALPALTSLPLLGQELLVATDSGIARTQAPAGFVPTGRALTRRALLGAAFELLDSPYGLGDAQGGRDCSGLLLDVFETFDLALPRFSGWQADAGSYRVDLTGASSADKLQRLELASRDGVVLLFFPGHIMLYLGKNKAGTPMVVHALGEYARACPGGGETIVDVQRTVVSTLELGQGSSRKSLLERATRLVVLGQPPKELESLLLAGPSLPPTPPARAAECSDMDATRIFVSPQVPLQNVPLRAIATSSAAIGGAVLRVFDEHGALVPSDELVLGGGGPPVTHVARVATPAAGTYTAVFGTAEKTLACKRIRVRDAAMAPAPTREGEPIWQPHWHWAVDTENLWSAFVERLFTGPPDDEQTWTNLQSLLQDEHRNLLYGHLGLAEDDKLAIEPDCADLPYALRAYFAWKLKLPYGFRQCSRGRKLHPPTCGDLHTTLEPRSVPDDVQNFSAFVNRAVRPGVHSATGRTAPTDSITDLYPVALERASLAPGTVYADPYGHVMMISKWFPQGSLDGSHYGVLMAAEAQPDGTIGRRRFWQGSFLFDPNTDSVGAGFKHFRPLEYDYVTKSLLAPDNAALSSTKIFAPYSTQEYQGTREDFYDRMDAIINPKPLAPEERMHSLIDALEEAAHRRVLAIDNAETYLRAHPREVVGMPRGAEIFETEGPWEDFATPSRDMRLLIAIDTVTQLPALLQRKPERFKLDKDQDPVRASAALQKALHDELAARSFTYTRSDGNAQRLSLLEVVERSAAIEVGYNPNDCVEARWGAAVGSPELASCTRHAPAEQASRMQTYRAWFHTRTRPARDD